MAKIQQNKKVKVSEEVLWSAVAAVIVFLPKALLLASAQEIPTIVMKMDFRQKITEQGKGMCPDPENCGPFVTVRARSRLDCARMCVSRTGCLHHAYNKVNGSCHHYYSTPAKLVPTKDCNFMVNTKAFEGCMPEAMKRVDPNGCSLPFMYGNKQYDQCLPATDGSTPQCATSNGQLADCIVPQGFSVQQNVANLPVGTNDPLPCVSNWIIVMQRLKGSVNFTRNWEEFKNGFGDLAGSDFWIGNEKVSAITNNPETEYMLRVEVQAYTSELWYYAEYDSFRLDSEANWYTLHVSGYSGDAGDSLSNTTLPSAQQQNGMKFSTYDADHDQSGLTSCARVLNGSWWFGNCYYSCLTCDSETFTWVSLETYGLEDLGRLKAAKMMIRRI